MALDLGKQIGPLPLGAWVAVVGVGLGIAYYTRKQQAAPEVVEDTSGVPGVGVGGGGFTSTQPASGGSGTGQGPPQTNQQWKDRAANWLVSQGYDALQVNTALDKYLNAGKLAVKEAALISLALAAVGPPPQGLPLPLPDETPPPTPTPDPTPTPTPTENLRTRVFYLNGQYVWGLGKAHAGKPDGWVETRSQATANMWAAAYESDLNADIVDRGTWDAMKAKYTK